jgi:hypothetical protein
MKLGNRLRNLCAPRGKLAGGLSWRMLVGCAVCLVAIAMTAPGVAQPGQNIAGNYRGLMTRCLAAPQPNACRKGLRELVGLADDVDARRVEWELVAGGSDQALADRRYGDYAAALDTINRGIVIFNRDMQGASSGTQ